MSRSTAIVRRPDFAGGGITTEEKAKLDEHAKLWISRAMRTEPIDHAKITTAIEGLYVSSGLDKPRVVIVSSPLVMAIAGGFAASIWHHRRTGHKTRAATHAATDDATSAATDGGWALSIARKLSGGDQQFESLLLNCCRYWYRMYQGGNMWSAWDCYLSACRDVLGLRLPEHEKYAHWEAAAIHGGFRLMHTEFCMVCDFPEVLTVDDENRPHGEHGPSHRWRDGWSLWHWHGVSIPEKLRHVIEAPERITTAEIKAESNEEVRRIMIERFGWERWLTESNAKVVHTRFNERDGQWERLYRMDDGTQRMVVVDPSTGRRYALGVPREVTTCEQGQQFLTHDLDARAIHRS